MIDTKPIEDFIFESAVTVFEESENLAINYLGQPHLGDVLECFDYDNKIYITRTEPSEEKTLIAIAK